MPRHDLPQGKSCSPYDNILSGWQSGTNQGFPQNGNEITIKQSAFIGDIQSILNACANDGPFVGTFTEESGPLGRRTEITKYALGFC